VATLAVTQRADLTDAQWAVLAPLLPGSRLGRPPACERTLIDGIRWRVRAGAPWRDVPPAYGLIGRRCMACSAAGSATAPGA
jgi:transposase